MDLLKPGQVFAGRYRVDRFLAEGGFGAVFVGEHVSTEQRVAIKVLFARVLASKDAVEKFELEAKVAGRVRSDHIVQVLDAGYDQETSMPFLVMELLVGHDLEKEVLERGPMTPAVVVSLMRQVASGLDKAHGLKDKDGKSTPIVHRDLKPENLFLTRRDTGEQVVKILDFGIAKVLAEGAKVSQEVKGTPLYMAFEQAAGQPITPRTDIWALGLIAHFLLTGRAYWRSAYAEESTIATLFGEILSMPIDPPSQRLAEAGFAIALTPAFDNWFSHCVNRDQSQRYQSAGDAVAGLADALGIPFAHGEGTSPGLVVTTGGGMRAVGTATNPGSNPGRPAAGMTAANSTNAPLSTTNGTSTVSIEPKKSMLPAFLAVAGVLAVFSVIGIAAFLAVNSAKKSDPPIAATPTPPTVETTAASTAVVVPPIVPATAPPATSVVVAPTATVAVAVPVGPGKRPGGKNPPGGDPPSTGTKPPPPNTAHPGLYDDR